MVNSSIYLTIVSFNRIFFWSFIHVRICDFCSRPFLLSRIYNEIVLDKCWSVSIRIIHIIMYVLYSLNLFINTTDIVYLGKITFKKRRHFWNSSQIAHSRKNQGNKISLWSINNNLFHILLIYTLCFFFRSTSTSTATFMKFPPHFVQLEGLSFILWWMLWRMRSNL